MKNDCRLGNIGVIGLVEFGCGNEAIKVVIALIKSLAACVLLYFRFVDQHGRWKLLGIGNQSWCKDSY